MHTPPPKSIKDPGTERGLGPTHPFLQAALACRRSETLFTSTCSQHLGSPVSKCAVLSHFLMIVIFYSVMPWLQGAGARRVFGALSREDSSGNGRDKGDQAREEMGTWPRSFSDGQKDRSSAGFLTGVWQHLLGTPVSLDSLRGCKCHPGLGIKLPLTQGVGIISPIGLLEPAISTCWPITRRIWKVSHTSPHSCTWTVHGHTVLDLERLQETWTHR